MSDDAALIARCRTGDADAWRTLVSRYERLVYSIAVSFRLDRADAADVTQSTFESLLSGLATLDEPDRIRAWMTTVAKRHAIRMIEARARRRVDVAAMPEGVADCADRIADIDWLDHGLAQLSSACQQLLIALYLSGRPRTYASVAEEFELPVGSIGPTRARCLAQLRSVLAVTS